jgi:hypothetical protein
LRVLPATECSHRVVRPAHTANSREPVAMVERSNRRSLLLSNLTTIEPTLDPSEVLADGFEGWS